MWSDSRDDRQWLMSRHLAARTDDDVNPHWGEIFGIYFSYILFLIILAVILDKSQCLDHYVHTLTLKSQNNLFPYILKERGISQQDSDTRNREELHEKKSECCDCVCGGGNKVSSELTQYKVEYLVELLDKPTYLATMLPTTPTVEGFKVDFFGLFHIQFPPGFFDDWLLYLMNNHSILCMFLSVKGHPYSRAEKRSTFFCQNCIALSFSVFIDALQLTEDARFYINIFVISPIMVFVTMQLYYILACPCLRPCHERGGCSSSFADCVQSLGWLLVIPIVFGCLAFLLAAALVNRGAIPSAGHRISSYAYSVHIVSATQEAMITCLYFLTGRYSCKLYICCCPVFNFGTYYSQKILCGLKEGVHYSKIPKQSFLCGLVGLEWTIDQDLLKKMRGSWWFCAHTNKTVPAPNDQDANRDSYDQHHQRALELVEGQTVKNV